jgi:hypothetical protein
MKMARKYNSLNLAGALIFIGILQWFMTVLAAETLFPGYSTRANDLSDLASTVPPNLSLVQPPRHALQHCNIPDWLLANE